MGGPWRIMLASALLATGCSESPTPRTQLTLVVQADDAVERDAERLSITFRADTGDGYEAKGEAEVYADDELVWPVSMALVPDSIDASDDFEITLVAEDGDGDVVTREVIATGFVPERTKLLEVELQRLSEACADADCGTGETCDDSGSSARCVEPDFTDPETLPDHTPLNDGGPDGSSEGGTDGGEDAGPDAQPGEGGTDAGEDAETPEVCEDPDAPKCIHGDCVDVEGEAACACDEGYHGTVCDKCDVGYGANDAGQCVPLCDLPSAPNCGDFGMCAVDEDDTVCMCDYPYAGDQCTQCDMGWALVDGACEADCGTCQPHSSCDASLMPPGCACAKGYLLDEGGPSCTWEGGGVNGGGILDNLFNDPDAWQSNGVTFAEDLFGADDGGATFNDLTLCEDARLGQQLDMPGRDLAEPFVLVVNAASQADEFEPDLGLVVKIGERALQRVPFTAPTQAVRMCMGDLVYGDDLRVEILPQVNLSHCANGFNQPASRALRALSFETLSSPSECPPLGTVPNGDFATDAAWQLSASGLEVAEIAGGQLHLHDNADTSPVTSATNFISIPSSLSNPALQLTYTNTGSEVALVRLGSMPWFPLHPQGSERTVSHCIPPEFLGTVRALRIENVGSNAAGATFETFVDDVEFVSDADCGASANRPDWGFETSLDETGWHIEGFQQVDSLGEIVTSQPSAHTGMRYLRLRTRASGFASGMKARRTYRVPVSNGDQRVQLSVWARGEEDGSMNGSYSIEHWLYPPSGLQGGSVTTDSTTWSDHTLCVDPRLEGELVNVTLSLNRNGGGDGSGYVDYDDVAFKLVPDSDC